MGAGPGGVDRPPRGTSGKEETRGGPAARSASARKRSHDSRKLSRAQVLNRCLFHQRQGAFGLAGAGRWFSLTDIAKSSNIKVLQALVIQVSLVLSDLAMLASAQDVAPLHSKPTELLGLRSSLSASRDRTAALHRKLRAVSSSVIQTSNKRFQSVNRYFSFNFSG